MVGMVGGEAEAAMAAVAAALGAEIEYVSRTLRLCALILTNCERQMGGLGGGLTAISQSQWENSNLSKFEKNFYQEHPAVSAMTQQDVDAFRASKQINVMGSNVPKPVRTFEEGSFPDYILSVVEKEYGPDARPTPVQSQVVDGVLCISKR